MELFSANDEVEEPRPLPESEGLLKAKDCEYCTWSEWEAVGVVTVNDELEGVVNVEAGVDPVDTLCAPLGGATTVGAKTVCPCV